MKAFLRLIIAAVLFLFIACKQSSTQQQQEFHYYPKTNMYLDVAKNKYLFSLDGAKTWDTLGVGSADEQTALGEKVVIFWETDSVWLQNEAHRTAYNGVLYNIIADDTDEVASNAIITEKKVTKKPRTPKKVTPEQKRETGFKKFVNKIFGKKKKD